jgi:hypothetical protein
MLSLAKLTILGLLLSLFINPSIAFANIAERFEFSGFARVIGGYLDESDATFEGYDNSLSVSNQSLFAVQGDFAFTETLSVSAQLLAHSTGI